MRPHPPSAMTAAGLVVATLLAGLLAPPAAHADRGAATARLVPATLVGDGGGAAGDRDDGVALGAALPEADRVRLMRAARSRRDPLLDDPLDDSLDDAPVGEIDARQRAALRRSGWAVPAKLAESWVLQRARVLDDEPGTLQLVYTRSARRLSVFQRAAPLDWSSLPGDGRDVPELPGAVREWPDADPARMVWQADDRAFVLVGDEDRDTLLAAAGDLPAAEPESAWQMVRRGVSSLLKRLTS